MKHAYVVKIEELIKTANPDARTRQVNTMAISNNIIAKLSNK